MILAILAIIGAVFMLAGAVAGLLISAEAEFDKTGGAAAEGPKV